MIKSWRVSSHWRQKNKIKSNTQKKKQDEHLYRVSLTLQLIISRYIINSLKKRNTNSFLLCIPPTMQSSEQALNKCLLSPHKKQAEDKLEKLWWNTWNKMLLKDSRNKQDTVRHENKRIHKIVLEWSSYQNISKELVCS